MWPHRSRSTRGIQVHEHRSTDFTDSTTGTEDAAGSKGSGKVVGAAMGRQFRHVILLFSAQRLHRLKTGRPTRRRGRRR